MRILFLMRNPVYVIHYESTLRLLASRGHRVFVGARAKRSKDPLDLSLALDRLCRECPQISLHPFPLRKDSWAALVDSARAFGTYARYLDPRYEIAHSLRARAAQHVTRLSGVRVLPRQRLAGVALAAAARAIERAVPSDPTIERAIAAFEPDVMAITPLIDFNSSQPDYVKSARRLGVPTVWCVASWDNLTNKGVAPVVPDRVLVWNEVQRREAIDFQGVPADRVVVTGAQTFDPWFTFTPATTPETFADIVGLPSGPFLLYVCSSVFIAPNEVRFVRKWLERLRGSGHPALRDCGVLIRPHPANAAQWANVSFADSRVTVWPRSAEFPFTADAKQRYFDSLFHSAAVVGINSSGLIEAGIVGRRCVTLQTREFADSQQGTIHFDHLLRFGFLTVTSSWKEHLDQLDLAVRGELRVDDDLRRRMLSFVRPQGVEGPSTPRVAAAIEAARELRPGRGVAPAAVVQRMIAPLAAVASRRRMLERRRRVAPGDH